MSIVSEDQGAGQSQEGGSGSQGSGVFERELSVWMDSLPDGIGGSQDSTEAPRMAVMECIVAERNVKDAHRAAMDAYAVAKSSVGDYKQNSRRLAAMKAANAAMTAELLGVFSEAKAKEDAANAVALSTGWSEDELSQSQSQ